MICKCLLNNKLYSSYTGELTTGPPPLELANSRWTEGQSLWFDSGHFPLPLPSLFQSVMRSFFSDALLVLEKQDCKITHSHYLLIIPELSFMRLSNPLLLYCGSFISIAVTLLCLCFCNSLFLAHICSMGIFTIFSRSLSFICEGNLTQTRWSNPPPTTHPSTKEKVILLIHVAGCTRRNLASDLAVSRCLKRSWGSLYFRVYLTLYFFACWFCSLLWCQALCLASKPIIVPDTLHNR